MTNNIIWKIAHIDTRSAEERKKGGWESDNSYIINGDYDSEDAALAAAKEKVGKGDADDLFVMKATQRVLADPQPLTVTVLQ